MPRVCISGYFDPIHIGHLEYIKCARRLADGQQIDTPMIDGRVAAAAASAAASAAALSPSRSTSRIRRLYDADYTKGELVVIVNNDRQARLKKGKPFMPECDRAAIIDALRYVDRVIIAIDEDRTVSKTISQMAIKPDIFANGGDQTNDVPERKVCEEHGIKLVDGLGAKIQSSSWLTGLKKTSN
jgi:glycerol-3-phosphate cytidylyltransferase-like family protein